MEPLAESFCFFLYGTKRSRGAGAKARNKNPRGRDHGVFSYYGMPITTSLVAGLSDWSLGS
jgi:hypothetical protein